MKYISYSGTPYQKRVTVPEKKKFGGRRYDLIDVFPNYGVYNGHTSALGLAQQIRTQNCLARVDPHSGYTAVYAHSLYRGY